MLHIAQHSLHATNRRQIFEQRNKQVSNAT